MKSLSACALAISCISASLAGCIRPAQPSPIAINPTTATHSTQAHGLATISPEPPREIPSNKRPSDPNSWLAEVPERYQWLYRYPLLPDQREESRHHLPFEAITLTRGSGWGTGEDFTVTLERSGKATLIDGRLRLRNTGAHFGRIDLNTYARLNYAIEQLATRS